jgi:hypothetical protein
MCPIGVGHVPNGVGVAPRQRREATRGAMWPIGDSRHSAMGKAAPHMESDQLRRPEPRGVAAMSPDCDPSRWAGTGGIPG